MASSLLDQVQNYKKYMHAYKLIWVKARPWGQAQNYQVHACMRMNCYELLAIANEVTFGTL